MLYIWEGSGAMRYEEIINEVIQYIEGNLHQSIGTEKIAQLAGLLNKQSVCLYQNIPVKGVSQMQRLGCYIQRIELLILLMIIALSLRKLLQERLKDIIKSRLVNIER